MKLLKYTTAIALIAAVHSARIQRSVDQDFETFLEESGFADEISTVDNLSVEDAVNFGQEKLAAINFENKEKAEEYRKVLKEYIDSKRNKLDKVQAKINAKKEKGKELVKNLAQQFKDQGAEKLEELMGNEWVQNSEETARKALEQAQRCAEDPEKCKQEALNIMQDFWAEFLAVTKEELKEE